MVTFDPGMSKKKLGEGASNTFKIRFPTSRAHLWSFNSLRDRVGDDIGLSIGEAAAGGGVAILWNKKISITTLFVKLYC